MKTKLTKNDIIALIAAREVEAYNLYRVIKAQGKHPDLAQNYLGESRACQMLMMRIRGELEA